MIFCKYPANPGNSVHVGIGKMMYDLPNSPFARSVWGIKLLIGKAGNRLYKALRQAAKCLYVLGAPLFRHNVVSFTQQCLRSTTRVCILE